MIHHIGFTGTRHGMTPQQYERMRDIVTILASAANGNGLTFHHGDCVGADAQFHHIVRATCVGSIVAHPPLDQSHRAHCKSDVTREPREYLRRNKAIVEESTTAMIAAPFEMDEQRRGGTWSTIRVARRLGRPLVIALPDGSVTRERWKP